MTSRIGLALLALVAQACISSGPHRPTGRPPADPIADVPREELRGRGLAYARVGDFVRAEQYLQAALAKGAADTVVVPELVRVCVAASRLQAALAYAHPYLERHDDDVAMHYLVATLHMSIGDIDPARREFQRVLELEPTLVEAEFFLGLLAFERVDFDGARGHFQRYLDEQPAGRHSAEARSLMAQRATRSIKKRKVSR